MVPSKPAQYAGLGAVVCVGVVTARPPCRTMPLAPPPPSLWRKALTTMTQHTVRIWDLPTRIFHWALAACIVGLVITANGETPWSGISAWATMVLALLVFRLVWGLVGALVAFFGVPVLARAAAAWYLVHPIRGRHWTQPAGRVVGVRAAGRAGSPVGTGLPACDEIAFAGPLTQPVS